MEPLSKKEQFDDFKDFLKEIDFKGNYKITLLYKFI